MRIVIFIAVMLCSALFCDANAQEVATVFVQHVKKTTSVNPDLQRSYQLPRENETVRHVGVPMLIPVPQGGKGCFKVERSNPLLYTYTIGSKILKVETPDTINQVLKQLLALAPKAQVSSAAVTALAGFGFIPANAEKAIVTKLNPDDVYAAKVGQLFRITTEMEDLKLSSDTAESLASLAKAGLVMAAQAADSNSAADAAYKVVSDPEPSMIVKMLRASQITQANKAKRLAQEFNAVDALLAERLCSGQVKDQRLHLSLSIAGKEGVPADNLKKITGDTVTSFDIDPQSDTQLDFGPGMILNTLANPSKTFAVANGVITQGEGDQLLFRPAILANFRSWGPSWIWASLGVAGNTDGISDLFVGATGRFGQQVAGVRVAIGIGLAASNLPVGITKGAVGAALPDDIASLDKIIKKRLVPGLGVILTATGF